MIILLADSHRQGRLSQQPGSNQDAGYLRAFRSFSLCYLVEKKRDRKAKTDGTYADFRLARASVSILAITGRADWPIV
jgi:hypothetical protein